MSISLGNTTASLKLGSSNVQQAYLGTQVVYDSGNGGYNIGEYYPEAGGYVYYLDGTGGGQVAAPLNAPSGAVTNLTSSVSGTMPIWGSNVLNVTGTFVDVTSGSVNTIAMAVTSASFDRNAGFGQRIWNEVDVYNSASSNINGGFNDWYIPSINALDLIYDNLASKGIAGPWTAYSGTTGGSGQTRSYWSSTQFDTDSAWQYQMQDGPFTNHGSSSNNEKSEALMFRPVRTFTSGGWATTTTTTSTTTTTTAAPTTTTTTAFAPQYFNVRKCGTSDPTTSVGVIISTTLTVGQAIRPTQLEVSPATALPGYENACYELISTAISGTICGTRAPAASCAQSVCTNLPTTTTTSTTTAAP
jgi:hypothetical protein